MVKKTSFREGPVPNPRKQAQRKGQGSQKTKLTIMTWKKLTFGTFKTSLFTIWAVTATLLTACGTSELLEVPETPLAKTEEGKPANDSTTVAAKKAAAYTPLQINYYKPKEILPILSQLESEDERWIERWYAPIDHLGIAEGTKIRDMMWKYGAWSHSPDEYKNLMSRLYAGMTLEEPIWYDNYEYVWEKPTNSPTNHATNSRNILNTILDDKTKFLVHAKWSPWWVTVAERVDANPDNIYIFWNSIYWESDKERRLTQKSENMKKNLARSKNFLIFATWWNAYEKKINWEWVLNNKNYQEDIIWDESWAYRLAAAANWSKNKDPNNHVMVTVGTNRNGDYNQGWEANGSKFQVGFHDQSLFAWRTFPYRDNEFWWSINGGNRNYDSSYPNYVNVAMASLCFQMGADVEDVDELLDRIRSTALTDYVRLDMNGDGDTDDVVKFDTDDGSYIEQPESQPLLLINPAGYFREYNLPKDLPEEIKTSETLQLEKGYYKGVVFDIPGAEVLIDGEWTPYDQENADIIKAQNPFTLEWRLNGERLWQLGYADKTIEGTIITVDDQWKGLNHLSKTFTVNVIKDISTSIKPVYK